MDVGIAVIPWPRALECNLKGNVGAICGGSPQSLEPVLAQAQRV